MKEKLFRSWDVDQQLLFPPSLHDWLPEDHLVFQILDVVEELDIGEVIDDIQTKDPRGTRPYHPRMMLALLIYAYSNGVYSSRRIEQATYDQIPFRVLTANQHPHFSVINDFRNRHRQALPGLFTQVLMMCRRLGLVKLGHLSLDGTKMKANASKHKAMSYERMGEEISRLEVEIRELLAKAEEQDADEDQRYGRDSNGQEIPEELRRRESRLAKLKQVKEELEKEGRRAKAEDLRERAEELRKKADHEEDPVERKRKLTRAAKNEARADRLEGQNDDDEDSPSGAASSDLPKHRVPTTTDDLPKPEAQRNFTDPDSRIMKRNQDYLQGYNAQVVVDEEHQIIVAQAVTNQPPDQEHLIPMLQRARTTFDETAEVFTADAGYISAENVEYCEAEGIDAFIATQRSKHGKRLTPADGPFPDDLDAVERMAAKIRTARGRKIYARRKTIAEPVFGQVKEARGFRRFSVRGLDKVRGEWTLVCLCHNILKMITAKMGDRLEASAQPSPSMVITVLVVAASNLLNNLLPRARVPARARARMLIKHALALCPTAS